MREINALSVQEETRARRRCLRRLCDTYRNRRRLRWLAVLWLICLPAVLLPHASSAQSNVTNVGLAATGTPQIDKERVAFLVSESGEGEDLNGDGDTNDTVLHVFDAKKGTTTNVGLAALGTPQIDKERVAFTVSESAQGTDLNGDGDTNDVVPHVFDAKKGTTINVGLVSPLGTVGIDKERVVFLVSESGEGTDLNDDGDTNDNVLHVLDVD